MPIVTMIISSILVAFFISTITCYILAKVTSMPSRRNDIDDDKLAGATYRAKVDNLRKTPKLSTVKFTTKDYENGTESKSVKVREFNATYGENDEKNNI